MHRNLHQEDALFPLKLGLCLLALFLLRYAGLVYFFLAGLFALYFFWKRDFARFRSTVLALGLASMFVFVYFYTNYLQTGFASGISRVHPEGLGGLDFLRMLLHGLWNAFSIARNYYFTADYLYLLLFSLQACVVLYLLSQRKEVKGPFFKPASAAKVLVFSGLFYLCWIILLRRLSPFNELNYRILAPFVLPFYLGLFAAVLDHPRFYRATYRWLTAFMLLSLGMNLPKVYIFNQLKALMKTAGSILPALL